MTQRNLILAGAAVLIALAFFLFGERAQSPVPDLPPAPTAPATN